MPAQTPWLYLVLEACHWLAWTQPAGAHEVVKVGPAWQAWGGELGQSEILHALLQMNCMSSGT